MLNHKNILKFVKFAKWFSDDSHNNLGSVLWGRGLLYPCRRRPNPKDKTHRPDSLTKGVFSLSFILRIRERISKSGFSQGTERPYRIKPTEVDKGW